MKVLLVDDEDFTREGILLNIPWKEIEVSEVFEAEDGYAGLDMANTCLPDILLTDVRMPKMDGIDLADRIKTQIPDVSIIFMSGYSDKEYLKSAIELSAVNYIEKPVDLEELKKTLIKTVRQRQKTENEKRRNIFGIPALQKQVVRDLQYYGDDKKELTDMVKIAYPEINTGTSYVAVSGIVLNRGTGSNDLSRVNMQALCSCIRDYTAKSGFANVLTAEKNEHEFIAYFSCARDAEISTSFNEFKDFCNTMTSYLAKFWTVVILVGSPVPRLMDLHSSFKSATSMKQYAFFAESGSVIYFSDRHDTSLHIFNDAFLHDFYLELQENSPQNAKGRLSDLYKELTSHRGTSPSEIRNYYAQLISLILHENRHDQNAVNTAIHAIFEMPLLSEISEFAIRRLDSYYMNKSADGKTSTNVRGIMLYIERNFTDTQMTLQKIADTFCLSMSHISSIFKKETGITINQFLINCRIEKAKIMIGQGHLRIKEIAEAVGFHDANYFNKVFKKQCGMTPLEYRALKT